MAQPSIGARDAPARAMMPIVLGLTLLGASFPLVAPAIDHFDVYRYRLEINQHPRLCEHMQRVYNGEFRQPWDYRDRSVSDAFPKLDYVVPDAVLEHDLFHSKYPSTPEFERIPWKEGRGYFDNDLKNARPVLIAQFDINNDGTDDLVIKHSFMLSPCPGGGSCPGGEDHIAVLRPGALDISKPLELGAIIKQYLGETPKGSVLSYDTLRYAEKDASMRARIGKRMGARNIRPFVLEGKTYLSIYDAWAVNDPKRRREWMWVLEYKGGGNNPLTRRASGEFEDWQPAKTTTLCRFRMIPAPPER